MTTSIEKLNHQKCLESECCLLWNEFLRENPELLENYILRERKERRRWQLVLLGMVVFIGTTLGYILSKLT